MADIVDFPTDEYHGLVIPDNISELDPLRVEAVREVVRLINTGMRQAEALREVAPMTGVTTRQLHRWAATHGMPLPSPGANFTTKAMAEAVRAYAKEQRLDLGNRLMDLAEASVTRLEEAMEVDPDFIPNSKEMKELTTAFAILTDKRRLEDGDPTSRHEISSDTARAEILSRLDKLSERRAQVVIDVEPTPDSGTVTPELPVPDGDQDGGSAG